MINKYLNRIIPFLLVAILLISCKGNTENANNGKGTQMPVYTKRHLNVVMVPDLSNRIDQSIYQKLLHDTTIINVILNQVEPSLALFKRNEKQLDKWSLMTPSSKQTMKYKVEADNMKIDFSRFEKQLNRINYVLGRDVEIELKDDLKRFKNEVRDLYNEAVKEHKGLDLYQFFNESFDHRFLPKEQGKVEYKGSTFINQYQNILILLTDGYIETKFNLDQACKSGKCTELHSNFISWVASQANTIEELKKFIDQNGLGIQPVKNPVLEDFQVVVIEVDDRSLNDVGNRKRDGLTDFEITKFFWEKWMNESGAKSLTYLRQFESKLEVERAIGNILKGDG